MSFISVFDVMGPNMIGPSSSHTAGAARIAFLAQKMIMPPLKKVEFTLYGSFARTYKGHGTDRALLGGIMGFSTDDMRIRNSFDIATDRGIDFSFTPNEVETGCAPQHGRYPYGQCPGPGNDCPWRIPWRRQGPHCGDQPRKS